MVGQNIIFLVQTIEDDVSSREWKLTIQSWQPTNKVWYINIDRYRWRVWFGWTKQSIVQIKKQICNNNNSWVWICFNNWPPLTGNKNPSLLIEISSFFLSSLSSFHRFVSFSTDSFLRYVSIYMLLIYSSFLILFFVQNW